MLHIFNKIKKTLNKQLKNVTNISYLVLIGLLGTIAIGCYANANVNHDPAGEQLKNAHFQAHAQARNSSQLWISDSSMFFCDSTLSTPKPSHLNDSLRVLLAQEIDTYIKSRFPQSQLTGKSLVEICEKHDFDICFALAQAEIESGYGTAGKGKTCNNPWNVGAYDGRSVQEMKKKGFGYSHPDHSIEPYVVLVKTKYLGSKRTIHDLMKNYVTLTGYRYASGRNYETKLKSVYQRICNKTQINNLQQELKSI